MAEQRVDLGRDSSGRRLVLDARTVAMLRASAQALGITELTVIQGSYMGGAAAGASASTHDGGGVADIRTWDLAGKLPGLTADRAVLELRRHGFAAWHRQEPLFADHIHAVALGCPELSPAAAQQARAYRRGRNGLSGPSAGPDDGPRVKIRTWEQIERIRRHRAARRAFLARHPRLARLVGRPVQLRAFLARRVQLAREWGRRQ